MRKVAPIPKQTEIDRESLLSFSFLGSEFQVSKFLKREGGPMKGLGTDHVISRPMKGIKQKMHPMAQTDRPMDMATL